MSNTASGREVCFFNSVAAFCERGCCGSECCSTTTDLSTSVTNSLIGCIAALMFIFFVICATYLVLRHRGYCPTRTGDPVKPIVLFSFTKKGKGKKGKKEDDKPSTWDQKHKDAVPKDTRHTQTETHKKQPGDQELFTKGKWPLVTKAHNIPKNKNARAVGTQTVAVKNNAKANNQVKVDNTARAMPVPGADDVRNTMITPTAPASTKATDNLAGSRSASFVQPEQRGTERQDTIDLLNDFTRQVMKN